MVLNRVSKTLHITYSIEGELPKTFSGKKEFNKEGFVRAAKEARKVLKKEEQQLRQSYGSPIGEKNFIRL